MKLLSDKMLILLAINMLIASAVCASYSENSGKSLGDTCILKNNQEGVCSEILNCEPVKKLFDAKKFSEIVECQFVGKRSIVCCPTAPLQLNRNPKFTKALCINAKPDIKVNFNIINGVKAEVGEFPYQVALGYRTLGSEIDFRCGGSLIAENIVITAAHCANKNTDLPVIVRLGRTSLNLADADDDTQQEDVDVDKIKINSKYSRTTRQNDIALVKLKRPVKYTEFIQPICLSTKGPTNSKENFTISGFGTFNTDTQKRSEWLLKGTVNEYPLDKCKKLYKSSNKDIIDSQFCAQSTLGVDGCQGDSGGPIIYVQNDIKYLFGVISYGSGCGSTFPGIYTRIDKYLDWIEKEMTALG